MNIKYSQRDWENVASHTNCANKNQPTSKLSVDQKIFLNEYTEANQGLNFILASFVYELR